MYCVLFSLWYVVFTNFVCIICTSCKFIFIYQTILSSTQVSTLRLYEKSNGLFIFTQYFLEKIISLFRLSKVDGFDGSRISLSTCTMVGFPISVLHVDYMLFCELPQGVALKLNSTNSSDFVLVEWNTCV